MNQESMKEISSAATAEVIFVYDIYKQEGGKPFSNSRELLVVQLLVQMTPHVLAKSDSQMMSACMTTIYKLMQQAVRDIFDKGLLLLLLGF